MDNNPVSANINEEEFDDELFDFLFSEETNKPNIDIPVNELTSIIPQISREIIPPELKPPSSDINNIITDLEKVVSNIKTPIKDTEEPSTKNIDNVVTDLITNIVNQLSTPEVKDISTPDKEESSITNIDNVVTDLEKVVPNIKNPIEDAEEPSTKNIDNVVTDLITNIVNKLSTPEIKDISKPVAEESSTTNIDSVVNDLDSNIVPGIGVVPPDSIKEPEEKPVVKDITNIVNKLTNDIVPNIEEDIMSQFYDENEDEEDEGEDDEDEEEKTYDLQDVISKINNIVSSIRNKDQVEKERITPSTQGVIIKDTEEEAVVVPERKKLEKPQEDLASINIDNIVSSIRNKDQVEKERITPSTQGVIIKDTEEEAVVVPERKKLEKPQEDLASINISNIVDDLKNITTNISVSSKEEKEQEKEQDKKDISSVVDDLKNVATNISVSSKEEKEQEKEQDKKDISNIVDDLKNITTNISVSSEQEKAVSKPQPQPNIENILDELIQNIIPNIKLETKDTIAEEEIKSDAIIPEKNIENIINYITESIIPNIQIQKEKEGVDEQNIQKQVETPKLDIDSIINIINNNIVPNIQIQKEKVDEIIKEEHVYKPKLDIDSIINIINKDIVPNIQIEKEVVNEENIQKQVETPKLDIDSIINIINKDIVPKINIETKIEDKSIVPSSTHNITPVVDQLGNIVENISGPVKPSETYHLENIVKYITDSIIPNIKIQQSVSLEPTKPIIDIGPIVNTIISDIVPNIRIPSVEIEPVGKLNDITNIVDEIKTIVDQLEIPRDLEEREEEDDEREGHDEREGDDERENVSITEKSEEEPEADAREPTIVRTLVDDKNASPHPIPTFLLGDFAYEFYSDEKGPNKYIIKESYQGKPYHEFIYDNGQITTNNGEAISPALYKEQVTDPSKAKKASAYPLIPDINPDEYASKLGPTIQQMVAKYAKK